MHVLRNNAIEEVPDDFEPDFELEHPEDLYSAGINNIPLLGNVQVPRWFYGARFGTQAMAITGGEEPLVQNLSTREGKSFDELLGKQMGAVRANKSGEVVAVDQDTIVIRGDDGEEETHDLYWHMPMNQKSGIHSRALVKPGDRVEAGGMVAASNYVNDRGVPNMGRNALIAMVPYKGMSMDDAIPISESFAKRMTSQHYKTIVLEDQEGVKFGTNHFRSVFPTKFGKSALEHLDEDGVVKAGTILKSGDPIALMTKPKVLTSGGADIGRLGKSLRQARQDASQVWDDDHEAEVVDVRRTKKGRKITIRYEAPATVGDKIVLRQGNKGTVSAVIPDRQMPRTADGKVIDLLLNPLSLNSRANAATPYELKLGKIAKKLGKPIRIPAYLPKGQSMADFTDALLAKAGMQETEEIFDPQEGRVLDQPVSTGYGFVHKLHHVASSKASSRGVAGYTADEQPIKGKGEQAGAKRLSGLESAGLLSAGAYNVLREGSTLRGQKNDAYWQALRQGQETKRPGEPFVWKKFRHLLAGAGINVRDEGRGQMRLAPFTDRDLDAVSPVEIKKPDMINLADLSPITGGLFDPAIVAGGRWGRITLPEPMINPAFEDAARALLGVRKKDLEELS